MRSRFKNFVSNPLTSGSALMIVGSMAVNVVNYIYHLVMGRALGPEQYGILASIYSILYIVGIIPQSSSVTIVKFVASAKSDSDRAHVYVGVWHLVRIVAVFGGFLLLGLAPLLQDFLHINSLWPLVWVVPIYYYTISLTANQATLQGILSFFGVVFTNFVTSIVKFVLGLLFIWFGWSVGGATLAIAIGAYLAYKLSERYISSRMHVADGEKSTFDINKFLKYSTPVVLQALAFTSIFTLDLVLVKHFFSDYDAGLYAALSTLGKIIFFAASPITAVMFPLVSKRKSEGGSVGSIFFVSLLATSAISFSVVLVYALFPTFTIGLLYGPKYVSAAYALPWMGVFIAVYTLCQLIVNFFLSIDKLRIVLLPLMAAVLQIVLIWFFHSSLLLIIQISLVLVLVVAVLLLLILIYNRKK